MELWLQCKLIKEGSGEIKSGQMFAVQIESWREMKSERKGGREERDGRKEGIDEEKEHRGKGIGKEEGRRRERKAEGREKRKECASLFFKEKDIGSH